MKNNVFQIISIGKQHWKKGYTYAFDACKILKDQGFDFQFTLVGGIKNIEFDYHVHDLRLEDSVTLIDTLPDTEVQALLKNADLLLLSSVADDVTPVILEAMLKKTLVLSTDWAGIQDVIQDYETGFIVPIRNSKRMAETIREIATLSKDEKERIREKAFETIRNAYGETQIAADMIEFHQILKNV